MFKNKIFTSNQRQFYLDNLRSSFRKPLDGFRNIPRVYMYGKSELYIENCTKILNLTNIQISLECHSITIIISGKNLKIIYNVNEAVKITGEINSITNSAEKKAGNSYE